MCAFLMMKKIDLCLENKISLSFLFYFDYYWNGGVYGHGWDDNDDEKILIGQNLALQMLENFECGV